MKLLLPLSDYLKIKEQARQELMPEGGQKRTKTPKGRLAQYLPKFPDTAPVVDFQQLKSAVQSGERTLGVRSVKNYENYQSLLSSPVCQLQAATEEVMRALYKKVQEGEPCAPEVLKSLEEYRNLVNKLELSDIQVKQAKNDLIIQVEQAKIDFINRVDKAKIDGQNIDYVQKQGLQSF